jgi:cysteine-rich repeat protein
MLDAGEACDDGNAVGGDGCRANCSVEVCGDGLLDGAEACDDGNRVAGDACSPTCIVEVEPGSDEHWINVGGPDFNDFQGHAWFTDAPFVNGGRTATSNTSIQYTELDPLYQSRRYGPADGSPLVFELPVPDMGPYRVRLYFVELDGLIRGQRIFDVIVEEAVRLEDLDVYRSAGPAKAHIRETYVNVDDGLLTVRLEPQLREAMISGIQVTKGTPTTSRPRLVTVKNR